MIKELWNKLDARQRKLVAGAALILCGVWLVLRGDIGDAPSIGTAGAGL